MEVAIFCNRCNRHITFPHLNLNNVYICKSPTKCIDCNIELTVTASGCPVVMLTDKSLQDWQICFKTKDLFKHPTALSHMYDLFKTYPLSNNNPLSLLTNENVLNTIKELKTQYRTNFEIFNANSGISSFTSFFLVKTKMEIDCSICLDSFEISSFIYRTPCNHYFHQTCLTLWDNKSCPICRKFILMDPRQYFVVFIDSRICMIVN